MDPMTDLDRALREAVQVEPGPEFTARIRARVADTPPPSRIPLPAFALPAIAGVIVIVVAVSLWQPAQPANSEPSILPSRDLRVMSPASPVLPSRAIQPTSRSVRERRGGPEVLISRSEMLALQRLFAGLTVAPPATTPTEPTTPPEELSIPKIEIEPLARFPARLEGEDQ